MPLHGQGWFSPGLADLRPSMTDPVHHGEKYLPWLRTQNRTMPIAGQSCRSPGVSWHYQCTLLTLKTLDP